MRDGVGEIFTISLSWYGIRKLWADGMFGATSNGNTFIMIRNVGN